jgi:hypothetical protein
MTERSPEEPQLQRSPQSKPRDDRGSRWGDRPVFALNLYSLLGPSSRFSDTDGVQMKAIAPGEL